MINIDKNKMLDKTKYSMEYYGKIYDIQYDPHNDIYHIWILTCPEIIMEIVSSDQIKIKHDDYGTFISNEIDICKAFGNRDAIIVTIDPSIHCK